MSAILTPSSLIHLKGLFFYSVYPSLQVGLNWDLRQEEDGTVLRKTTRPLPSGYKDVRRVSRTRSSRVLFLNL